MTVPLVGELALWVALLLAAWGTVLSAIAGPLARRELARSGERAAHAAAAFLALAVLALWLSLLRTDLSLQYVARRGGLAATLLERTIAVWSAPAGAILILALAVALLSSVAVALLRHSPAASGQRAADAGAPAAAASQLLLVGVLVTALLTTPPFAPTTWAVSDGQGLPPAWRHAAMLAVWPLWAFGTAAATAAFGLAVAASVRAPAAGAVRVRPAGDAPSPTAPDPVPYLLWRAAERWLGVAWVLVTASLVTALWWSYHTMERIDGWIARAVDPVTALAWLLLGLASVGMFQRVGSARARLIVTTVPLLLLLAASLVRPVGSWDPLLELAGGSGAVWWIVTIAALVQVAVYAVVRARQRETIDRRAPAAASANVGALGVRLVAVGAGLAVAGIIATGLRAEHALELEPGQPATARDVIGGERRVVFQGLSVRDSRDTLGAPRSREVLYPIAVGRGVSESIVIAEVREYVDLLGRPTAPPRTFPGVRIGVVRDIVALADSVAAGERAFIRLAFVPLTGLIWLGALTMLVGGVLAAVSAWRRSE